MDKKELRERFETWITLENDVEMHKEIIKLGQEKHNAKRNFLKYKSFVIQDYFVEDNKIYFSDNNDDQVLIITIDKLFSDIQEWIKKFEEDYNEAVEEQNKERKQKKKQKIKEGKKTNTKDTWN